GSTRLPAVTGGRGAPQHTGADEIALDLHGARADAQPADVAVHALDRVLAREPVAAEQLDGLVAHELRGEVCRGLRHRGLERGRRAVRTGHVHRALQQQARAFELRGHVGDLPLETLEIGQGLVADLALVHVVHRVLERALRGADAHRRVPAAFVVDV